MHNAGTMASEPASSPDVASPPPSPAPPRLPTPGAAVALFTAALATNIAMSALFEFLSIRGGWLLVTTPLLLLGLTVGAVALFRLAPRQTLQLRLPSAADVFMAVPLAVSFVVLSDQLSSLTQELVPVPEELARSMVELLRTSGTVDWVVKLSTIGVLAAVSEELLFRGFIQNGLLRGMSRSAAVLWTSFLFMLMHILPLPNFAAAGIVLGVVSLASRSILVPILVHFLNNVAALALLNLAGLETLAEPVWIPPTILLPALAIFGLTMGYYLRKLVQHPEESPRPVPRPGAEPSRDRGPFGARPAPSIAEELASVPGPRRRLGWLVVLVAVALGVTVLGGVFFSSIYVAFPKDVHASVLQSLEQESTNRMAISAYERAPELQAAFDALEAVNARGSLTGRDVWNVVLAYTRVSADGEIDSPDVDELVGTIQQIVRSRTSPRRL